MSSELQRSAENVVTEKPRTNRLGFVGFVVSILGIITFGLLSPIALLLSAMGLFKRPRGYAAAGTALGIAGSALLVAIGTAGYFLAMVGGQVFAEFAMSTATQVVAPLMEAADAIDKEAAKLSSLPNDNEGNKLIATHHDFFGKPLRYASDGKSYSITMSGGDATVDSRNDIRLTVSGADRRFVTAGPDGRFNTPDDSRSDPIPVIPAAPELPKK